MRSSDDVRAYLNERKGGHDTDVDVAAAESSVDAAHVVEEDDGQCAKERWDKAKNDLEWIRYIKAESEDYKFSDYVQCRVEFIESGNYGGMPRGSYKKAEVHS